jgi:acyl dehydratase
MTSLYYEDVVLGTEFLSPGRTVTEADLTMVCMLSGDWNPLHCDAEFAAQSPFGQRIVGGVYGLIYLTGAISRWSMFADTTLGMLSIEDWSFKHPVFIGDTLKVKMVFADKRVTSKPDRGIVQRAFEIINQQGIVVQSGKSALMVRRRTNAADT